MKILNTFTLNCHCELVLVSTLTVVQERWRISESLQTFVAFTKGTDENCWPKLQLELFCYSKLWIRLIPVNKTFPITSQRELNDRNVSNSSTKGHSNLLLCYWLLLGLSSQAQPVPSAAVCFPHCFRSRAWREKPEEVLHNNLQDESTCFSSLANFKLWAVSLKSQKRGARKTTTESFGVSDVKLSDLLWSSLKSWGRFQAAVKKFNQGVR